jgi:tripartite-type tricarboxylate transporter receptor subunit TctC
MFAPARTPAEILGRLSAEISKLLSAPEFRAKFLVTQGIDADELTGRPPPEFAEFLKADRDNVIKVLTAAGLRPEAASK